MLYFIFIDKPKLPPPSTPVSVQTPTTSMQTSSLSTPISTTSNTTNNLQSPPPTTITFSQAKSVPPTSGQTRTLAAVAKQGKLPYVISKFPFY